jgi:dimethylamine--corrinoid protein Co-methyltransferase
MPCAHATACGMNGLRAAGDLVARVQMTRGVRLPKAKHFVAERLGVGVADLSDCVAMQEVRRDLGLGLIIDSEAPAPDAASAMEAKMNIAELLSLPINCVDRFRRRSATVASRRGTGPA